MANNRIEVGIVVDDNGTLKEVANSSSRAASGLNNVAQGAQNADRNLKGAAQSSSNGTKNFSKMAQGMGGLVAGYATLAAQLFAVSAAFNFLKSAGQLEQLKAGQMAYASTTGVAMRTLTSDIVAATDAQISFTDAAQAAAIGTAAGLSADQLSRLGTAAKDASQILGRDVTDSFNRLVRGVTKAEPELLDELGIILRLKDASEAYAAQLDKDVNSLTQFEKSQAVTNDVLAQSEAKYARILEVVGSTPNQYSQLGVAFESIVDKIKEYVSIAAGPLASVLTDTPALGAAALLLLLNGPMKAIGLGFGDIAEAAEESAQNQIKALEEVRSKIKDAKKSYAELEDDLKRQAQKATDAGTSSKTLQKLAQGGTFGAKEKRDLERSLAAAERQIEEFNEVRRGVFAGADIEIIRSLRRVTDEMRTATDEQVSLYESLSTRISAGVATIRASFATFVSSTIALIGSVVKWLGILAASITFLKTATEWLRKEGIIAPLAQKSLTSTEILFQRAEKRVISLTEEYEKFVDIQRALYLTLQDNSAGIKTFITQAGGALASMLTTSFSSGNINAMTKGLQDYGKELEQVRKYEEDRTRSAVGGAKVMSIFIGQVLGYNKITKSLKAIGMDISGFNEGVFNSFVTLNKTVDTGLYVLAEWTNALTESIAGKTVFDNLPIREVSELAESSVAAIKTAKDSLSAYKTELESRGLGAGSKVFNEFSAALENFEKIGVEGLSQDQITAYSDAMKKAVDNVAKMDSTLKNLPESIKASGEAFSSLENSILQISAGDASARALRGSIKDLLAIEADYADNNKEGLQEIIELRKTQQKRLELSISLAEQENNKKVRLLSLQLESIRNYGTMSKAQGEILKKEDQITSAEQKSNDILIEMQNVRRVSILENGKITEEAQRRLNILEKEYNIEDAKADLYEQQLALLKKQKPFNEELERLVSVQKLIGAEKELLDIQNRQANLAREVFNTRQSMAKATITESTDKRAGGSIFFNKEKAAAEQLAALEQRTLGTKIAFIDLEYKQKVDSINLEYDLLDAKKLQTANELEILALNLENQKKSVEADKARNLAAQLEAQSTAEARQSAIELAQAKAEASKQEAKNSVNAAQRTADQLSTVTQIATTFQQSLRDGVDGAITALVNGSKSFKEAMKELVLSVAESVRQKITDIALDSLFDSIFKKDDPAQKVQAAHVAGAQSFVAAGTTVAGTIQTAITAAGATISAQMSCCGSLEEVGVTAKKLPHGGIMPELEEIKVTAKKLPMPEKKGGWFDNLFGTGRGDIATMSKTGDMEGLTLNKSKGSMSNFLGSLGDIFNKNAEGGFVEKLGIAFEAGGSMFGDLFGGLGNMFGDLFGNLFSGLGGLFGGSGGGGFLSSALGLVGGFFGMPFAKGGYAPGGFRAFADGGMVTKPTLGLVGEGKMNEAIVPLPNGRAIPVDMKGLGQNNNVVVNVSVDNQGNGQTTTESQSGADAGNLGQAIARAVQQELQNQKRSGGILNPYGVS